MSRAGHGLAFQRRNMALAQESGFDSPFLQYAILAAADPKAPAEFRTFGPSVWAMQFVFVTTGMWYIDPLRLREGAGLDEIWFSGYNPTYSWPGQVLDEIKSWEPERPHWAGW